MSPTTECDNKDRQWNILLRWLPGLIMACGIALRLRQYLHIRSLWLDEAFLADAMAHASFRDLLSEPLLYGHVLPLGFAAFSKAMASAFGNHELALRYLPFLLGCGVLPLAYLAARCWLRKSGALVVLALFSFSEILIFYTNEFKPYSCDVFFSTALIASAGYAFSKGRTLRLILLAGIVGLIAPWFSQPSLFVLFPVAVVGIVSALSRRHLLAWLAILALWGINVAGIFALQYGGMNPSAALPLKAWVDRFFMLEHAFMPDRFPDVLFWIKDSFSRMFINPGSLGMGAVPGSVLLVAGSCLLLIERHAAASLLFLGPFAICLIATRFHLYAFGTLHLIGSRAIVFLLPGMYLLIATGLERLHFRSRAPGRHTDWTRVLLLAWLFAYPIHQSLHHLRCPIVIEEMDKVLSEVKEELRETDTIYVYYWAEPAFRYYAPRYGIDPSRIHLVSPTSVEPFLKEVSYARIRRGSSPVPVQSTRFIWGCSESYGDCEEELRALSGRERVWIVYSHIDPAYRKALLEVLDRSGKQLRRIEYPGSSAYLYQL